MYLQTCGSFKSANRMKKRGKNPPQKILRKKKKVCKSQNILGPQIADSQSATFAEGPQI
jgi:hypothetical protein